ncbi:response regulator [Desulfoluna sp.]|uniref:response regulator n=1 Tax=Desulfoluna sp. TaxID=2045199 RepID=UPI00260725E1|nr:response regulator [Desulfoluna sp.]
MDDANIKILIIDDEEDIREGCRRSLARSGCEVLTAAEGSEGLSFVSEATPKVVFLDLKMPGMDGMEVLAQIQERAPSSLVIIMTGYATVESAITAMKSGAYDFIAKPFEPEQIRLVAGRALDHIRVVRRAEKLKRERERTLTDLGTEKSRIAAIVESLPNGVVVTNAYGMVVLMNSVFQRLFVGDRLMESQCHISWYIEDSDFCLWINSISTGVFMTDGKIPSCELQVPDNGFYLARGQHVLSAEGECLGSVVTLTDITDLKTFDQMKSEFVAKVAHELRSPLTAICEQLALVEEEVGPAMGEENRGVIVRARDKAGALIALIGDLLDLQRIEGGGEFSHPREVDPGGLLRAMVDFLRARAQAQGVGLTLELPETVLPLLFADPSSLESIYGNLITNAIKYTGSGGHVRVSVSVSDDDELWVAIADDGFGIEEKYQEKIFQKFYRIKDDKRRFIVGTGLGLSIVRQLVEGLFGTVDVISQPMVGSTFTVKLPALTKADTEGV